MIRTYQSRNQVIWYDDERLREPPEEVFDVDFWKQNDAIVGRAFGRGTTWFVQTATGVGALRHYRRGGLLGKLVSDSYWFTGWKATRSCAEFHLLKMLADAGVNVPRPIAAQATRHGFIYHANLLSEKIENAADLVDILQQRPLTPEEYQAIGSEVAKMHRTKVNHTDLNIHNILLDSNGKVWIIDFDKCDQQEGTNWQQGNLDRLLRSFRKEQTKRSIQWTESEFDYLLDGYQQAG